MRFHRSPKLVAYGDTSRKRAAFVRKQRLQREALPLFAEQIAATQHDVDEEMARRAVWWDSYERDRRNQRAARWRDARASLFALDAGLRRTIRKIWRTCPFPAEPSYFADLLHQIRVGKIDPHRPPWIFHAQVKARTTPNPATFAEAFRRIGGKTVQPDPARPPTEETLFCGNLGSGILFLTRRVRPVGDFDVTLMDGLAARSVASSGNLIEIEVRGPCPDRDLAVIGRIAQAAEMQPIVVKRIIP